MKTTMNTADVSAAGKAPAHDRTPANDRGNKDRPNQERKNTVLWTAQILLAAVFVFAAVPKLTGVHNAVQMFGQIGAGQWLRSFVGAAELAGAVGLLIPRLAWLAAAGLSADMAGATIINAAVLHSAAVAMTVPLCAAFALIARSLWPRSHRAQAAL